MDHNWNYWIVSWEIEKIFCINSIILDRRTEESNSQPGQHQTNSHSKIERCWCIQQQCFNRVTWESKRQIEAACFYLARTASYLRGDGEKLPGPTRKEVLLWLNEIWTQFPTEVVKKSFTVSSYVFEEGVDYLEHVESESDVDIDLTLSNNCW